MRKMLLIESAADPGGSLGSDEPPSGRVWWLKALELHGWLLLLASIRGADGTTFVARMRLLTSNHISMFGGGPIPILWFLTVLARI